MTRREFLIRAARWSIVVAGIGSTAALASRPRTGAEPNGNQTPKALGGCQGCPAFADCALPRASAARKAAAKTEHGT